MHHPVVQRSIEKRANDLQVKIAVRHHRLRRLDDVRLRAHRRLRAVDAVRRESPWQTLTLIVSLEAIFLSTFVMIGQNRQAAFQQAKADHDFVAQEQELNTNTELTKKIHELTIELHEKMCLGVDRRSDTASGPN